MTDDLNTDKLFTGQRLDATGLYYYNARYYDATIGRFISPDSIVPDPFNPQSLNRYSYCLNNPLKYVDPSGHSTDIDDWYCAGYVDGVPLWRPKSRDSGITYGGQYFPSYRQQYNSYYYNSIGAASMIEVSPEPVYEVDPMIDTPYYRGQWDMYGYVDGGNSHFEGGFYYDNPEREGKGYARVLWGQFDSHTENGVGYESEGDMIKVHADLGNTNASIEASALSVHSEVDHHGLTVQFSADLANAKLNFTDDSSLAVHAGISTGWNLRELEFDVILVTIDLPNLW